MEHESFENENVASIMNEYFVNIKGKKGINIEGVILTQSFS